MDNTKTFTFGGLEAELNLSNYIHAERWEDAFDTLGKELTASENLVRDSAKIRVQTAAISGAFDAVFGEGSARLALGEATDFETVLDAFANLVAFANAQSARLVEKYNKYAPRGKR